MTNTEKALKLFNENYNCSQSVFAAYCERFGINEKDACKISSGFGGGIGRTQNICGAITGAIMIIGSRYFNEDDVAGSKVIVYDKIKELLSKFKSIHNAINCLELTGIDMSKEGGQELFKTMKIHETKCNGFISDTCRILDEIL